jgi:hypothetical protein
MIKRSQSLVEVLSPHLFRGSGQNVKPATQSATGVDNSLARCELCGEGVPPRLSWTAASFNRNISDSSVRARCPRYPGQRFLATILGKCYLVRWRAQFC